MTITCTDEHILQLKNKLASIKKEADILYNIKLAIESVNKHNEKRHREAEKLFIVRPNSDNIIEILNDDLNIYKKWIGELQTDHVRLSKEAYQCIKK